MLDKKTFTIYNLLVNLSPTIILFNMVNLQNNSSFRISLEEASLRLSSRPQQNGAAQVSCNSDNNQSQMSKLRCLEDLRSN